MDVLLLIYNLSLQILYCIPVVYAWILFQHTRKHLYLYITGLFFFYSIENIIIFITEFDTTFAKFYDTTFMSVPTARTIIFVAVLLFMLLITTSILKEDTNYILLSLLGLITVFVLFVPMMKDSAIKVFIYYTPCQLFSLLVGLYGMKRLKIHTEYYDEVLRFRFHRLFLWTAIFSVLIIVEDWIVIFHFDNYGEQNIHITNRSYSENLMTIYFVFITLRILAPYLHSLLVSSKEAASPIIDTELQPTQTSGMQMDAPADNPADESSIMNQELSKFYLFSRDYQLTPREQHILQLLLENKTNVEIGDDLCISIGTAKAHVHNIFAKVEVKKRQQLLDVYEHYTPSDTTND